MPVYESAPCSLPFLLTAALQQQQRGVSAPFYSRYLRYSQSLYGWRSAVIPLSPINIYSKWLIDLSTLRTEYACIQTCVYGRVPYVTAKYFGCIPTKQLRYKLIPVSDFVDKRETNSCIFCDVNFRCNL